MLFYSGHWTLFFFTEYHCYFLFSSFANYALTDPAFSKMKGQNKYEAKYSETLVHRDLNQTLDMNLSMNE